MDTIKKTVVEKNRAYLKDICTNELQSMYDILIKPKVIKGTYVKSGGYKMYREDFARIRENVKQRLSRADSNLLQMSALDFERRYRKQDEEILEKANMTESQIKAEMQEQHEKLELEKSELIQKMELKRKEEAEKLELYKEELSAQREQERQELKEKYEQSVRDWQKGKEDLESKLKEQADVISKLCKQAQPSAANTQVQKPALKETVLKTMFSLLPVVGPIATGIYERYSST
ncbi:golgin subfamily A member 6-like protein 22 [Mercenaria mercenaria]|uniref:golgin subfamily A member 6-like protein 22 n=1 Tax=Mercenaria mercenaria TaxID=6596 RepID=UPI00234E66AD|nr:golgin subfamily A member 6-like protein 22 [Mercenaria mercenaria]